MASMGHLGPMGKRSSCFWPWNPADAENPDVVGREKIHRCSDVLALIVV